jgi:hypothetical protein
MKPVLRVPGPKGMQKIVSRYNKKKLWCSRCKKYHEQEAFTEKTSRLTKRQGWCKTAMKKYIKAWKAKYKETTGETY